MCGIAGYVGASPGRLRMEAANAALAHRGPDDEGIYLSSVAALAVRRLSIIDLQHGHQPLSNEDGTIWLAYNGEVFNAPALRRQLESAGHTFGTQTDTEVIVHAYEEWGDRLVEKLQGMYAFAVWDEPRRRLLLARDRFGIKPLYFAQLGGEFAFGSEVLALFAALPNLPKAPDHSALWRLFQLGFIPSPMTAFAGAQKLPAAHWLEYDFETRQMEIHPYWQLRYPANGAHRRVSPTDAAHEFIAHLRQAVEAWRLSDVPVGSLLSGGVDSASLAALLSEISGGQIHTFTIGFLAHSHDESKLARQAARAIGSHHHELTFGDADFDLFPAVLRHLEEPQCSATSLPIYKLYQACHEAGFKVIMTGEGADELLGGYHWFDGDRRVRPLLRLPATLRRWLARAPGRASAAARRVLAYGDDDPVARYALWQQVTDHETLASLFNKPASPEPRRWVSAHPNGAHPLDHFLYLESQTRMIDFINFEVDRMSMGNSVEARPPFLDHTLWEFCARLPPECKLSPNGNKLLLRLGMRGRLPDAVLKQPKRGLAAPHAAWWRAETLPAWAEDAIHPSALMATGYFNPTTVARLRHQHQTGHADTARLLTGILTTQVWHDLFIAR